MSVWQAVRATRAQEAETAERKRAEDNERQAKAAVINERLASLTAREREVLDLLVAGENNKAIARLLNFGYKTAEAHRARLMRKMQARNYPELVHMMLVIRRGNADPQ